MLERASVDGFPRQQIATPVHIGPPDPQRTQQTSTSLVLNTLYVVDHVPATYGKLYNPRKSTTLDILLHIEKVAVSGAGGPLALSVFQ
jgi:hypothetical protein